MTIRCDNIVTPYEDRNLAPYFDLVWLTASETKRLYDNWKVNSIFAPYAANPYTFKFSADNLIKKVCFVGTPYGSRTRMINQLTVSGINVDLYYGQRQSDVQEKFQSNLKLKPENNVKSVLFHRLLFKEGRKYLSGTIINKLRGHINLIENSHLTHFQSVNPSEIYKYYSNYSISLSSTSAGHTDILKKPLKIINLRNFEIPMSGGIQICRYNEELANYFEPEEEIVFYDSEIELLDKAKYLLEQASDSELRRIKTNSRKRAESEHTWYARFLTMFNALGIKV